MKKLALIVLVVMLMALCSSVFADGAFDSAGWQCPTCGVITYGNFCPKDGTAKQNSNSNAAVSSGISMPVFSENFPGYTVRLHSLATEEDRAQSYTGPGKSYQSSGAFKPYKQRHITAFFIENDWVYCFIQYQTTEDRCLYLKKSAFEDLDPGIPDVGSLIPYEGETISDAIPSWGPSSGFNRATAASVAAGTQIRAFFQENGYIYAEYKYEGKLVRMWLPADKVSIPGMEFDITDDPDMQTGRSVWQYIPEEKKDEETEDDITQTIDQEPETVTTPDDPKEPANDSKISEPESGSKPANNDNTQNNTGTDETKNDNNSQVNNNDIGTKPSGNTSDDEEDDDDEWVWVN